MRLAPLTSLLVALSLTQAACTYFRVPREPMRHRAFAAQGPNKARGAIVLLPGFGDSPDTFEKQGFVEAVLRDAPDYDVFAADAHFGYYRRRTLLERLDQDVVWPLYARGYRELWLMGASMGGHGAIAYARTHPDRIRGLVLFAPYMGPKDVIAEVKRAGGLCNYQDLPYEDTVDGFARANFLWLKQAVCGGENRVPIWLAVGANDRLLPADQLLAEALAPERVLVLPGGHGWEVWTPAVRQLTRRIFGLQSPAPSDLTVR